MLWTSNVLDEVAKLVSQRSKHLIFVFYRFCVLISTPAAPEVDFTGVPHRQGRVSIRLSFALGRAQARWWTVCGSRSIGAVHRRACASVSLGIALPKQECQGGDRRNVIP